MDINDPTNLTGISTLVNPHHINKKLDLSIIEKNLIGSSGVKIIPEIDPATEFKNTLKELSEDTGINLDDNNSSDDSASTRSSSSSRSTRSSKSSKSTRSSKSSKSSRSSHSSRSSKSSGSSAGESNVSSNMSDGTYSDTSSVSGSGSSYSTSGSSYSGSSRSSGSSSSTRSSHKVKKSGKKSDQLNDVLRTYAGGNSSFMTQEALAEHISVLLSDIDELRGELSQDGVDLSRIPEVDSESKLEDIKNVHDMLRKKYDRKRCNSLGNELILAGAQGLEFLFDGQRKWGPYQPNLTGWSNTIRSKLRRMRYETSTIVSGVMNDYNIGPTTRIAIELVPSAFLYSKMKNEQKGKNYTPDQMSEAYDDLRQFE